MKRRARLRTAGLGELVIKMMTHFDELADVDLTGKYILRKLHYHWFSYGKAGIITGNAGAAWPILATGGASPEEAAPYRWLPASVTPATT